MINKVTLIGNIGRDPELKNLEAGAKLARFSVATNESYKDKSGEWQTVTEWHNVTVWGSLAERMEKLTKGTLVYIDGKIKSRKYNDKDGNERTAVEIVARQVKNLSRKSELAEAASTSAPAQSQKPDNSGNWPPEDLPF